MRFLAVAGLFVFVTGWAQGFDDPTSLENSKVLKQQGRLFTVQLVLGEPIRFFVVGREEAKADLMRGKSACTVNALSVDVTDFKSVNGELVSIRC